MGCTCAGRQPDCAWGCGPDARVVGRFVPPWADAAYDAGRAESDCVDGGIRWRAWEAVPGARSPNPDVRVVETEGLVAGVLVERAASEQGERRGAV